MNQKKLKRAVLIDRYEGNDKQKIGNCYVLDENNCTLFTSKSIERGWNDNKKMISCLPVGRYPLLLEWSNRFNKMLWEIKNSGPRTECKFHSANYARQLNGCIALGQKAIDIDGDGQKDVTSSRKTMAQFHKAMEHDSIEAVLIITDKTDTDYQWRSL